MHFFSRNLIFKSSLSSFTFGICKFVVIFRASNIIAALSISLIKFYVLCYLILTTSI